MKVKTLFRRHFWVAFVVLFIISGSISFIMSSPARVGPICDSSVGQGTINGEMIGCPIDGTFYIRQAGYPPYLEFVSGGIGAKDQITEIRFTKFIDFFLNIFWMGLLSFIFSWIVNRKNIVQALPVKE